ncbi:MAG: hypothetical protein ACREIV_11695 [Planctomycetaceae bacterium]
MKSHTACRFARTTNRRAGAIVVIAMICLLVISMMSATLVQSGLARSRQAQREAKRLQAAWLVESGIDRAAAALQMNSDYTGETWNVSAEELGGPSPGQVTIQVATDDETPDRRSITVTADYPSGTEQRAREEKTIPMDL